MDDRSGPDANIAFVLHPYCHRHAFDQLPHAGTQKAAVAHISSLH